MMNISILNRNNGGSLFPSRGNESSTRARTEIYNEALEAIETITCFFEEVKTLPWISSDPPDLPGHVGGVPHSDEVPNLDWFGLLADRLAKISCSDPCDPAHPSCDPYKSVFDNSEACGLADVNSGPKRLRKPEINDWRTDDAFARSFLTGVNPLMVRLVRSLSEIKEDFRNLSFGVDGEAENVSSLLESKRLFMADYSSLRTLPLVPGSVFYAPQVLFARTSGGNLDLLAIHLSSPHHSTSHLVLEDSPEGRKLFAKMHVSLADAQVHEFPHHLRDHFVMEAFSIARHNSLEEDNHPIGRLLKPHMIGTMFINFAARNTLVAENNSLVQTMFSVGRNGALQLISEEMSRSGWAALDFPSTMEERGFPQNKSDNVTNYYYRDDGFALWDALHKYVEGVVHWAYPSDQAIEADERLKGFHASIADPDQGNIPGFPETPGTMSHLTDTLTRIIFTGSVQHQAVNAPQFTYSYVPHRPTLMTNWMPEGEDDMSWHQIKEALPPMELTKQIYRLTNTLSTPMQTQCNLLSLDVFRDESELKPVYQTLQNDLNKLKDVVESRMRDGGEYNFLSPENVACSIDI